MWRAVSAPFVVLTQKSSNYQLKTSHNANTLQAQRGLLLRLLRKGRVLKLCEPMSSYNPPSSSFTRRFRVRSSPLWNLNNFENSFVHQRQLLKHDRNQQDPHLSFWN